MRSALIEEVRERICAIPAGRVSSYGDIAHAVNTSARHVGRIMGSLDGGVPWWRVVRADGTPATCHGGRAPVLLEGEGTPMRGAKVDMSLARYRDAAWLSDRARGRSS
ncbi:MGMT family protein [Tsukamurella sp. PLM1]|uniref:MGMT family protein n=1 Tax=Tsukamurella sp. PLM1 TaxID=2929795 RepID=UPI00206ACCFF|nr:MGMT family protein [Tsukamurella sp. PLM1]BDH58204.1 methylated-DNA--protein-cysteine methyltransferase [Tsukamurella sp. PLM1]